MPFSMTVLSYYPCPTGSQDPSVDIALLSQGNHTIVSFGTFGFVSAFLGKGMIVHPENNPTYNCESSGVTLSVPVSQVIIIQHLFTVRCNQQRCRIIQQAQTAQCQGPTRYQEREHLVCFYQRDMTLIRFPLFIVYVFICWRHDIFFFYTSVIQSIPKITESYSPDITVSISSRSK